MPGSRFAARLFRLSGGLPLSEERRLDSGGLVGRTTHRTRTHRSSVRVLVMGLTLLGSSVAAPVAAQPAKTSSSASVSARFTEARKLFQNGDCESALPLFDSLYQETQSPNALLYVARCQRAQGAWDLAYESFRRTVAQADSQATQDPKYEATRDAARVELEQAAGRVGLITVVLTNDSQAAKVRVGSRELASDELGTPIAVMPGTVQVEATAQAGLPVTREVAITAGATRTVALALGSKQVAAAEEDHGASVMRSGGIVAASVGVLGMATFATFGMLAKDRYESLDEQCDGAPCPEDRQDDVDRGRMLQTTANVGLVVGVVGLATGATLFVLGWPRASEGDVQVAVGPGAASIAGTF